MSMLTQFDGQQFGIRTVAVGKIPTPKGLRRNLLWTGLTRRSIFSMVMCLRYSGPRDAYKQVVTAHSKNLSVIARIGYGLN